MRETNQLQPCSDTEPSEFVPYFIKPLSLGIDLEDIEYLRSKGAFEVPGLKLRTALLRVFFDSVHPAMPVLDLAGFLDAILTPEKTSEKISLLLFQAVLAAATLHVDEDALVASGFRDRLQACSWFTKKAKVSKRRTSYFLLTDIVCEASI